MTAQPLLPLGPPPLPDWTTAYREGLAAGRNGLPADACPYPAGTPAYAGWYSAHALYDGPTLTEALWERGLSHHAAGRGYEHVVTDHEGREVLRGRAGEVWAWLRGQP